MKILNCTKIRESEAAAVQNGVSLAALMRAAGERTAACIAERYPVAGKRFCIVCGSGNNGGDGLVIADYLSRAGAICSVLLPFGAPTSEPARSFWPLPHDIRQLEELDNSADYIVDALFGIGLSRAPQGVAEQLIEQINLADAVRIAVDLPSGVLCDGGVPGRAVRADFTVTMIAPKPCFYLPPSSDYCGELAVAEIAPPTDYSYLMVEPPIFRKRAKNTHKGSFGTALLVCGSYGMCGASILAARAALRSGVGLARAVVCDENYAAFSAAVPEAVTVPVPTSVQGGPVVGEHLLLDLLEDCDALLLGCGLGRSSEAERLVKSALKNVSVPVILDADGINLVCADINIIKRIKAPVILTPHPGEMARLCGTQASEVQKNRVAFARNFARENGCILVLKGANTVIAAPDGRVFFNTTGNPGMATGGSGDVLAGITVALLAQGMSALNAALAAVWLHGKAGDLAAQKRSQRSMLPSDIIDELILPEV